MAGDGEHQVVMLRVHGFDIRAQSSPELGKSLQRHRVGAGRWRDDAPAAFEQARKSRLRPTIFRARYRSEEHTSELQSLMRISYAVFCLKKNKHKDKKIN